MFNNTEDVLIFCLFPFESVTNKKTRLLATGTAMPKSKNVSVYSSDRNPDYDMFAKRIERGILSLRFFPPEDDEKERNVCY